MNSDLLSPISHPDRTQAPSVREFADLELPQYCETVLSNGIRLLTLDNGSQPVYRLSLRWEGGTTDSPHREVPEVMAASINEGTSSHTGAEIAEILEYNGAWTRYEAASHNFGATLFGLTARPGAVLDIFLEVLTEPSFPAEVIKARREKLAAQCRTAREKITSKVQDIFLPMVYGPDAPLARRSTPEGFLAVEPHEVSTLYRRQLKATPPRAYLVGRLTPELVAEVTSRLEKMVFEPVSDPVEPMRLEPRYNPAGEFVKMEVPDSLQSAIKIAIPAIDRHHPDFDALRIATIAFGGHFGSRLMQNIREDKGYTYGITAQLSSSPDEGAFVTIACQTDNGYTDSVLTEIDNEIRRMASEPLTDAELTGLRRLILSSLASVLDSPFTICDYIISLQQQHLDAGAYRRMQQTAATISADNLAAVFARYITPVHKLTAIAGK